MDALIVILLLVILATVFLLHNVHLTWLKHILDSVEILVRKNRAP